MNKTSWIFLGIIVVLVGILVYMFTKTNNTPAVSITQDSTRIAKSMDSLSTIIKADSSLIEAMQHIVDTPLIPLKIDSLNTISKTKINQYVDTLNSYSNANVSKLSAALSEYVYDSTLIR